MTKTKKLSKDAREKMADLHRLQRAAVDDESGAVVEKCRRRMISFGLGLHEDLSSWGTNDTKEGEESAQSTCSALSEVCQRPSRSQGLPGELLKDCLKKKV